MNIKEDFVSFETAKLLKEKGFNEKTYTKYAVGVCTEKWYDDYREKVLSFDIQEGELIKPLIGKEKYELYGNMISAPTLQMTMKWLREVCKLHIEPHIQIYKNYNGNIYNLDGELLLGFTGESPEQVCEAAIKYCLEHLI